MSYDMSLEIDTGGAEPAAVGAPWNYTTNCAPMWRAAGADLAEFEGKAAAECAPLLERAIAALRDDPERFEAMNPPNGWGSRVTLVEALENLLADYRRHPKATVRVWR